MEAKELELKAPATQLACLQAMTQSLKEIAFYLMVISSEATLEEVDEGMEAQNQMNNDERLAAN